MRHVLREWVKRWDEYGSYVVPHSVNVVCGACKRPVNLRLEALSADTKSHVVSLRSSCPNCEQAYELTLVRAPFKSRAERSFLFFHIAPEILAVRPMKFTLEDFPSEALFDAYESVLEVFNHGLWGPTAVMCRRLLEGVTDDLLGDAAGKRRTLAARLAAVADGKRLDAPIHQIAEMVKDGGNLAAHFDKEHEVDEQLATALVDFMEHFIDVSFVLGRKVEELRKHIGNQR